MASGIKILHNPLERDAGVANISVDIVAIHGIGAHPDDTWTYKRPDERTNWLADPDMLPKAAPTARIMRFGYESTWFGTEKDEPKRTNVCDVAEMLLRELHFHRKHATWPIIFIAHSYGGLVLLQALRRSFDESKKWSNLFRYTGGLVFFGTPFRGRAGLSLEEIVDVVATNNVDSKIYPQTMALSVQENPYLKDIVLRYTETRRDHPIPLVCFYETKPSPIGKTLGTKKLKDDYLVTEESACLDYSKGIERHSLERHHYNLQKFPRVHDAAYRAVEDAIIQLVNNATAYLREISAEMSGTPQSPISIIPFRRDEDFVQRGQILDDIRQKLAAPHSRIALVGLGGVGKSQIAIEYAYQVRYRSTNDCVFWVHASNAARYEQGFREIAQKLEIPKWSDSRSNIFELVCSRLREEKRKWTLILDNVDDADFMFGRQDDQVNDRERARSLPLIEYLPKCENGSILITTRSKRAAEQLVETYEVITVDPMDETDALVLVNKKLRSETDVDTATRLVLALDYMPLAIVQATAYIAHLAPRCSMWQYLEMFEESNRKRANLLKYDRGQLRRDYEAKNSIITTWHITFNHIRQTRPTAADLLALMSYFDRQGIPEYLLRTSENNNHVNLTGSDGNSSVLGGDDNVNWDSDDSATSDRGAFEDDVALLRDFSLVSVAGDGDIFEMHRLVQIATQKWLANEGGKEKWKHRFLSNLSTHLPNGNYENWRTWQTLLPHARAAVAYRSKDEAALLDWATILDMTAWFYERIGNGQDAEKVSVLAMKVRTKLLGTEHQHTLNSMATTALAYKLRGRWGEAEKLLVEVMEARKRILGTDHPDTLASIYNLSATYHNQGRWEEAEKLDMEVLQMRKLILGTDHPDTLVSIHNLAATYWDQGRWKEAEELQVEVMETSKQKLGTDHPDTLSIIHNLAATYWDQGRWKEAEKLQVEVLQMRKQKLGTDHPDTLTSMGNLASMLYGSGRHADALDLLRNCVQRLQMVLGLHHPAYISSAKTLDKWVSQQTPIDMARR